MSVIRHDTEIKQLQAQVEELTKRIEALESKKKPGRPPKNG